MRYPDEPRGPEASRSHWRLLTSYEVSGFPRGILAKGDIST